MHPHYKYDKSWYLCLPVGIGVCYVGSDLFRGREVIHVLQNTSLEEAFAR